MATHKSAKKRSKQTIIKTEQNKVHRSKFRSVLKKLRAAISEGNKEEAQKLLPTYQSTVAKLGTKGIYKKNNIARKTSRITNQVSSLS